MVNLVYVGAVYHAHFDAFRDMIVAIEKLGRSNVQFHIFTNQEPDWLAFRGIAAPTVTIHPHLPLDEVEGVLREADVLFLGLAFKSGIDLVIKTSSPGKLGDYLAAGRPILVHAPHESFVSQYFRKHQCGIVVDSRDTTILAQALENILTTDTTQMINRALICAQEDFDLPGVHVHFKHLLETISQ
jgi:glycosyltransferase involved in cell wall biosynthesis